MSATGDHIVRPAWCQADRRYGRNAGKQCVGMCLGFAVYTANMNIQQVLPRHLNAILDFWDHIYGKISQHVRKTYLMADDLPSLIEWKDGSYKIKYPFYIIHLIR